MHIIFEFTILIKEIVVWGKKWRPIIEMEIWNYIFLEVKSMKLEKKPDKK